MLKIIIISVGLVGACLTTFSSLPQVIKIIKTRRTHDISLITYIMLNLGIVVWLIYGILIVDIPLIFANIISLIFVVIILVFKIIYK
jgi:MtN3 and saliva related transmembrane protein